MTVRAHGGQRRVLAGIIVVILGLATIFAVLTTRANLPIMLPLMVATAGVLVFGGVLWRRERPFPFFELGVVYAAAVFLYTAYPLIGFLSIGMHYGPYNDGRLFSAQPTPAAVGTIGWYYVGHLVAFLAAYLLARGRLPPAQGQPTKPGRTMLYVLLSLYVLISGFLLWLDQVYHLSAATYVGSYLNFQQLPPGIAQVAGLLDGARFTVKLAILAVFFCHYRRYWPLVFLWLALDIGMSFVRLGSRTETVLLLLAAILLYHRLVRPISLALIGAGALAGLSLFVILGLVRNGWLFSGSTPGGGSNPFSYASEFEVIFGNAYDLSQRRANGEVYPLPAGFFLADLTISIPRQLLPFEKVLPADWYVNTFYPAFAAQGGGLAFGTVSESILGGGWLDVLFRGAALGFLLAQIQRYLARHRPTFWRIVFYAWLATQLYQPIRNTTFFPFYLFLYRFLWVALGVEFVRRALKGRRRAVLAPATVTS